MTEQTSNASSVNAFYLAFYGRPADPAGLNYWVAQLQANGGDLGAIADAFATSDEARERFGGDSAASRITEIYQQLFNRAPDSEGLAYWNGLVETGDVALADVGLDILKGAREVDLDLSTKRLHAVEAFTARVEAGGTGYEGSAAIEAARVLLRSVTANATEADIDEMVGAAVSFADTATKTPAVIDAIATGSSLLALFDSRHGQADPVALVQTLADTAKAAAGNPATLESLLRGGGMAGVLNAMPAGVTLKDVVDALAKGGLSAAIDVVYPTVVTPEKPISSLAFKSVSEGTLDQLADHVTNVAVADVTFSYKGGDLRGGQVFEYSTDGEHWIRAGIEVDTRTNTVVVRQIDLTAGSAAGGTGSGMAAPQFAAAPEPDIDLATTVQLRAVAASGTIVIETSQQIIYDSHAATPRVVLANDTAGENFGTDDDLISKEGAFTLTRVEDGATVEYQAGASWTSAAPTMVEGENTFLVRQTDKAGNISNVREVKIVVDSQAPSAPSIALVADTGVAGDGITNDGRVALAGLEQNTTSGWEFSTDGGESWQFGAVNDGSGEAVLDLTELGDGAKHVKVRQVDAAGNVGPASGSVEFSLDATGPDGTLAFDTVEGTIRSGVTTLDVADVQFTYSGTLAADEAFQYRIDGGAWATPAVGAWDANTHKLTIADLDLSAADHTVEVRISDIAGNDASASMLIDSTFNNVPERSTLNSFSANFAGNPGILFFNTTPQNIIPDTRPGNEQGLANKDTFLLESMRTGSAAPTAQDYLDGQLFQVYERMVRVDDTPVLDFYRVSWSDDTFLTSGDSGKGYLAAGSAMFVAGRTGLVSAQGFNIAEILTPGASHVSPGAEATNTAFIDDGHSVSHIVTGGGMDLVVDHGGTLTLGYDKFATADQDVIIGFDAGNDRIEIGGDAAAQVDRDLSSTIAWQDITASGSKAVVFAGTEAVQLTVSGWLLNSTSTYDVGLTLATLNNPLDLTGVQQGDGVLILASTADRGGLFYYTNKDGNGVIDAAELTYVNLFIEGIVKDTDVELVGIAP